MKLLNHLGSLEIRMKNFVSASFTALALLLPLGECLSLPYFFALSLAIFITQSAVYTYTYGMSQYRIIAISCYCCCCQHNKTNRPNPMWSNAFIVVNVIHSSIWISMCHLSHSRKRKRRSRHRNRKCVLCIHERDQMTETEMCEIRNFRYIILCEYNDVLVRAELHERMDEWMRGWFNEWLR